MIGISFLKVWAVLNLVKSVKNISSPQVRSHDTETVFNMKDSSGSALHIHQFYLGS